MKHIGIIAGTSEATGLIQALGQYEWLSLTAFVATSYGSEILDGQHCTVQVGRLDEAGFCSALETVDGVIDASHPFAVEVTQTVRRVCRQLGLPYFRYTRSAQTYTYDKLHYVPSKEAAAQLLAETEGNILLTTGGNTLHFYEATVPHFAERGYARILDTPDSRKAVAGSQAHLLYAMPPFSVEDTVQLIVRYGIQVLVSKDSGKRGGVPEKIQAAKQCGIPVILIRAPQEQGQSLEEIVVGLERLLSI